MKFYTSLFLALFISQLAYSFEHNFAVTTNAAQVLIGGLNLGLEYNPNHLPFDIELFASSSRERPGDDLIAQKYTGIKVNYNVSNVSALEDGFLIRAGVENVDLDYYWDNKSNCVAGCPGNNYRSKTGAASFTRYNFGLGLQGRSHTDWMLFGRENYILFRAAIEKNWSDRDEVDAVDRDGNPLKEKLPQFNGYSAFVSLGITF